MNSPASRAGLFVISIGYSASLLFCMNMYASVEWARFGHTYLALSWQDGVLLISALAIWAAVVPVRFDRASAVLLSIAYLAVCIPGVVVPLALERVADERLQPVVLAMIISFAMCCMAVEHWSERPQWPPTRSLHPLAVPILVVVWLAGMAILIATYHDIMTVVSLEAIYTQRAAGAATNRFLGYAQTYIGYVVSPALIATGWLTRRWWLVLLGMSGGLVLYSITAEKNAFAFPFLMMAFGAALNRRHAVFRSVPALLAVVSILLAVAVAFSADSAVAAFFSWYVGVRSLLTPGLVIAQYLEFFDVWGHTLLAQVTGFSSVIIPPAALEANDRWPSLGHIVGEQYVGFPEMNANGNFVASDGIASFGVAGVPFAFALLALYLILLDRCARGVDARYTMLAVLPLGLTLTNVSLITSLISFGGIFWLLYFRWAFVAPRGSVAGEA